MSKFTVSVTTDGGRDFVVEADYYDRFSDTGQPVVAFYTGTKGSSAVKVADFQAGLVVAVIKKDDPAAA